jgi:hypothetical protein
VSLILVLLRGSGVFTAFLALFTGVYGIAAAPTVPASPLGLRGLRRVRTMRSNPVFARMEPLVRWLGVRLQPLLGEGLRARIDRQIMLAGDFWGLVPEEFVALSLVSSFGAAGFGWALALLLEKGALYPTVAAALGLAIPYLELTSAQQARMKHFQNGLPYVIIFSRSRSRPASTSREPCRRSSRRAATPTTPSSRNSGSCSRSRRSARRGKRRSSSSPRALRVNR